MVDGCRNKLVNVVLGVPHGSGLDPPLVLLYTAELFSMVAVVPSPAERIAVTD